MIIHCVEFGSYWYSRLTRDSAGNVLPKRSAYFNTTAIRKRGSQDKYSWCTTISGFVRMNVAGFPKASLATDFLGANAFSRGLESYNGSNRLFLSCSVERRRPADRYLVVVNILRHGRILFTSNWKSYGVSIVAASATREFQETMLLMTPDAMIRTEDGVWGIQTYRGRNGHLRAKLAAISQNLFIPEVRLKPADKRAAS